MVQQSRFNLKQAAKQVGVSPITLKRWLLSGKVKEVPRDRNGWRVFTQSDVNRIRKFAETTNPPNAR